MAARRRSQREHPAPQADVQAVAQTEAAPASGQQTLDSGRAGGSLDRFSASARRVLATAEQEARRLGHAEIRPEHLLLAMLAEGRAPSAYVMTKMGGMEPAELRRALEERLGRGDAPVEGPLELGAGCKRVLQLAVEDARRLRHPEVDTSHLLAGLVAEGSAIQGEILTALALRGLRVGVIGARPWGRRPPDAVGLVQVGPPSGTRDNVVTLRIGDADLAAVDALVEVGIARTRSEGAAWLLHAGIAANQSLFERAQGIVEEIRRLREEAQQLAQEHAASGVETEDEAKASAEHAAMASE